MGFAEDLLGLTVAGPRAFHHPKHCGQCSPYGTTPTLTSMEADPKGTTSPILSSLEAAEAALLRILALSADTASSLAAYDIGGVNKCRDEFLVQVQVAKSGLLDAIKGLKK